MGQKHSILFTLFNSVFVRLQSPWHLGMKDTLCQQDMHQRSPFLMDKPDIKELKKLNQNLQVSFALIIN